MTLREEALQAVNEVPEDKLEALLQFARFLIYEAELEEAKKKNTDKPRRRGGWIKGKVWMSDDFNDPMDFVSEREQRVLEAMRASEMEAEPLQKVAV